MNYAFDFENKGVLITGAASGIGLEATRAFLQNKAEIFMADYNKKALEESAALLRAEFPEGRIHTFVCDITDGEARRKLAEAVKAQGGDIDILINNAGMSHSAYSIYEKQEDWERVISLNLTAQFFMAQLIANEFFIPKKRGKVVNSCSLSGIMGIPGAVAYSASKGGVMQMTKSLAAEWARFGITVNSVCPGFVDTPLIADNMANEKWVSYMTMRTPMRRLARPDDVAGSILFFASDMADYVTGASIVVDGGFSSGS